MSDLRSACIEAMAEAMPNRCAFVEDVTPAFDALLGVLEEHADEWIKGEAAIATAPGPRRRLYWRRMGRDQIEDLLAVLREDT